MREAVGIEVRNFFESDFGESESGDDEWFAGVHQGDGFGVSRDSGERGDIAAAEVFGKGGADSRMDFGSG